MGFKDIDEEDAIELQHWGKHFCPRTLARYIAFKGIEQREQTYGRRIARKRVKLMEYRARDQRLCYRQRGQKAA